jgi:uncharacterized membrane protein YdbT with pleckstrin-like domain
MGTPDKNVQMTEHLQPSVLVIVLRLLGVIFLLDTAMAVVIAGFYALNNAHEWHNAYIGFLLLAHTFKYIVITVTVVKLFADWAGRAYYLTGHHLVERLGLVNTTETTYELSQVKSVVVQQAWLGRHFNYGTIKLKFAGGGKQTDLLLRDIHNPSRYKEYFDQYMQVQGWVR